MECTGEKCHLFPHHVSLLRLNGSQTIRCSCAALNVTHETHRHYQPVRTAHLSCPKIHISMSQKPTPLCNLVIKPPPIRILRKWWMILNEPRKHSPQSYGHQLALTPPHAFKQVSSLNVRAKAFFPKDLPTAISEISKPRSLVSNCCRTRSVNNQIFHSAPRLFLDQILGPVYGPKMSASAFRADRRATQQNF